MIWGSSRLKAARKCCNPPCTHPEVDQGVLVRRVLHGQGEERVRSVDVPQVGASGILCITRRPRPPTFAASPSGSGKGNAWNCCQFLTPWWRWPHRRRQCR